MAEIVWMEPAVADLEEVAEYISFDDPDAADRVILRIMNHVGQLSRHQKSGPIPPELPDEGYRQIVEPPCRIFYKIDGDTVFIVHVMRAERILRSSRLKRE